jgi:hypothetical protein
MLGACQPVTEHGKQEQQEREFSRTNPVGHYQALARPDGSVWVLDTRTGTMQRCDLQASGLAHCGAAAAPANKPE